MAFEIKYNEEKNQILKATRGISFEDIINCITEGGLLDGKHHPDPGKSHQRIYIVRIDVYAYVVPYIINQKKAEIFLKTTYPSRKYTNNILRKENCNVRYTTRSI